MIAVAHSAPPALLIWRAIYRLAAALPLLFLVVIVQGAVLLFRHPARDKIPHFFHRAFLFILGVRVRKFGAGYKGAAKTCHLFVANHASWFDVFPLGAVMSVCFVAKAEMRDWPLFGKLAQLQRTFFVNRKIGRHILAETNALYRRWHLGDNMLIFPEATTTSGLFMLPFKTTFFAPLVAIASAEQERNKNSEQEAANVYVQPLSICYKAADGVALGRGQRLPYGWLGEVSFLAHFIYMLTAPPLTIDIYFGTPLEVRADSDRKELAHASFAAVRTGLDALIMGTAEPAPARPTLFEILAEKFGRIKILQQLNFRDKPLK